MISKNNNQAKNAFFGKSILLLAALVVIYFLGLEMVLNIVYPNSSVNDTPESNSSVLEDNENKNKEAEDLQSVPSLYGIKVGDIVTLGQYEQDGNILNGKEPLQWEVIGEKDGKFLLLSHYVIDSIYYDNGNSFDVLFANQKLNQSFCTWERSTIREYLNTGFYEYSFSEKEKEKICKSIISTGDWSEINDGKLGTDLMKDGSLGGPDVEDYVFLLSIEEIREFCSDGIYYNPNAIYDTYIPTLLASPTVYAMDKGNLANRPSCFNEYAGGVLDLDGYARLIKENLESTLIWNQAFYGKVHPDHMTFGYFADWALRSPGGYGDESSILYMKPQGNIRYTEGERRCLGLRPAIWVTGEEKPEGEIPKEEKTDMDSSREMEVADGPVYIGAPYLTKHRGKIYISVEGNHILYVDNLYFYPVCYEHGITDDIEKVSYHGILYCLQKEMDVRDFVYSREENLDCFVSESQKVKFVYNEEIDMWSFYSNTEKLTQDEGMDPGEWVHLFDYYEKDKYEVLHEEYVKNMEEEEKKEREEKIRYMENLTADISCGDQTIWILPPEGFLLYAKESNAILRNHLMKEDNVVALCNADSYEFIVDNWEQTNGPEYGEINDGYALNMIYSIRDSVEEKIPGFGLNNDYDYSRVFRVTKEELKDSKGEEIIMLEVTMESPFYSQNYEQKKYFVEVYNYALENDVSMSEAYQALGYEGEFWEPSMIKESVQREYYKKLDNGKYLCLTVKNYDKYEELFYIIAEAEFTNSEEYETLVYHYGRLKEDEIIEEYLSSLVVPHDEFLRYLEEDCYKIELHNE